jgi:hypothetical protein
VLPYFGPALCFIEESLPTLEREKNEVDANFLVKPSATESYEKIPVHCNLTNTHRKNSEVLESSKTPLNQREPNFFYCLLHQSPNYNKIVPP